MSNLSVVIYTLLTMIGAAVGLFIRLYWSGNYNKKEFKYFITISSLIWLFIMIVILLTKPQ